jgi:hypothetical protein
MAAMCMLLARALLKSTARGWKDAAEEVGEDDRSGQAAKDVVAGDVKPLARAMEAKSRTGSVVVVMPRA